MTALFTSLIAMQDVVSIKIYTTAGGFLTEQLMYDTEPVSSAVGSRPEFSDNADCSAMCTLTFVVFPPYSVSQRSPSLEERLRDPPAPSLSTAVEVRFPVCSSFTDPV
jgi:hypothetical protein